MPRDRKLRAGLEYQLKQGKVNIEFPAVAEQPGFTAGDMSDVEFFRAAAKIAKKLKLAGEVTSGIIRIEGYELAIGRSNGHWSVFKNDGVPYSRVPDKAVAFVYLLYQATQYSRR